MGKKISSPENVEYGLFHHSHDARVKDAEMLLGQKRESSILQQDARKKNKKQL